jgi:hypothetical protein
MKEAFLLKMRMKAVAARRWPQCEGATSAPVAAESGAEAPAAADASAAAAQAHAAVELGTSVEAPAAAAADASAAAAEAHTPVELGTPAEAVGSAAGGESAPTTEPAGYTGRPKRACTESGYDKKDWYIVIYCNDYPIHHRLQEGCGHRQRRSPPLPRPVLPPWLLPGATSEFSRKTATQFSSLYPSLSGLSPHRGNATTPSYTDQPFTWRVCSGDTRKWDC